MARRRWIADEVSGNRAALTGQNAAHLARVLRARAGQEFDVATGERVRRGRIVNVWENRVEFELGEDLVQPAGPDLTLLLAIYKFDRMEWALEKAVELGARRIVPVIARRTSPHLSSSSAKRVERWRRIAREASQQARRASVPDIPPPLPLKEAMASDVGTRIVLAEGEQQRSLRDVMAATRGQSSLALAVGPEGGWTEDELRRFAGAGWIAASLGSNILRAETAAIAALAIVLAEAKS
ncbi:MAG: 16S rRNA (uracil(1498)-N(3))-methyltransferase [Acidobacteria bacterium]|nr:16S rRNA (uracil(1498)-N(3))-methyltransferase [Acidobacteriota bacterium]